MTPPLSGRAIATLLLPQLAAAAAMRKEARSYPDDARHGSRGARDFAFSDPRR